MVQRTNFSVLTLLGNVADPVLAQDASTKAYTDSIVGSINYEVPGVNTNATVGTANIVTSFLTIVGNLVDIIVTAGAGTGAACGTFITGRGIGQTWRFLGNSVTFTVASVTTSTDDCVVNFTNPTNFGVNLSAGTILQFQVSATKLSPFTRVIAGPGIAGAVARDADLANALTLSSSDNVFVNGTAVANANFQSNAAALGTDYLITGSNITAGVRRNDVAQVADGEIGLLIGSVSNRIQMSNGESLDSVIISQLAGQPVLMSVFTATQSGPIVANLNSLGVNALTISPNAQSPATNTLLVESYFPLAFQVQCTFPAATTLLQVQALFGGLRSDNVFFGGPNSGRFVFQPPPEAEIIRLAGSGAAGGANTQIQFNNNGAFGGSAQLTWNGLRGLQLGTLATAAPLVVGDAPTPLNLTPGIANQVLTSAGGGKTPYWGDGSLNYETPLTYTNAVVSEGTIVNSADIVAGNQSNVQVNAGIVAQADVRNYVTAKGTSQIWRFAGNPVTFTVAVVENSPTSQDVILRFPSGTFVDFGGTVPQGSALQYQASVFSLSLFNRIIAGSNITASVAPDVNNVPTLTINSTGGGGGGSVTAITSPNSTILIGGTASIPTIDVAIPLETLRIDGRIATNIGANNSPTSGNYVNGNAGSVTTGFGNQGTTWQATQTIAGYNAAVAALLATGATPPATLPGSWTLPIWPIYISNLANPTATQYGTVTGIQATPANSVIIVTFSGNAPYFANVGVGSQPLFTQIGKFTFVATPQAEIIRLARANTNDVTSLNDLKGDVTLASPDGTVGITVAGQTINLVSIGSGTGGGSFTNFVVTSSTNQEGGAGTVAFATTNVPATNAGCIGFGLLPDDQRLDGGIIDGVKYLGTTQTRAGTYGWAALFPVAATYALIQVEYYTPPFSFSFSTLNTADPTSFALDTLLFSKAASSAASPPDLAGNIFPGFQTTVNPSDDVQLLPVVKPTLTVTQGAAGNLFTATVTGGQYIGIANNFTNTVDNTTVPYIGWLRLLPGIGGSITSVTNVVINNNTNGIYRATISLSGSGGGSVSLQLTLNAGNTANNTGTNIGTILLTDSLSTKTTTLDGLKLKSQLLVLDGETSGSTSIKAAAVTTSYQLTLPGAQGTSGQTLSNDGTGILSWVTGGSGPGSATLQGLTDTQITEPVFALLTGVTVTTVTPLIKFVLVNDGSNIAVGDWLRSSLTQPGQLPAIQVIFKLGNNLQFSFDPTPFFTAGDNVYRLPATLEGSALFFSNAANKWIPEIPNNTIPLDTLDWVNSNGDIFITDVTVPVFDSAVTTNSAVLSSPWTFATATLPFLSGNEIVGVDTFGRMVSGEYLSAAQSGTATAILENVLIDRRAGGGFSLNQAYTLSWRQGKFALPDYVRYDRATNLITQGQAAVDLRTAALIGASSTTYINQGVNSVGTGYGNAGTTWQVDSASYAAAVFALKTTGATQPASFPGSWTLPGYPILISNILSPTATQFGTITQISDTPATNTLIITFSGNAAYFTSFTTAQPLFTDAQKFTFVPAPQAEIIRLAANAGGVGSNFTSFVVPNGGTGTLISYATTFDEVKHSIIFGFGLVQDITALDGGYIGTTKYLGTTQTAVTPGYGYAALFPVATTYTTIEVEIYTPTITFNFTTDVITRPQDYVVEGVYFSKADTTSGNPPYLSANIFPGFAQTIPGRDGIKLIPITPAEINVVQVGSTGMSFTATITGGFYSGVVNSYNHTATTIPYLGYYRMWSAFGSPDFTDPTNIALDPTVIGSYRALLSLPTGGGGGGGNQNLQQVLNIGNRVFNDAPNIGSILLTDNVSAKTTRLDGTKVESQSLVIDGSVSGTLTLNATTLTNSYSLTLPPTQASAAGQTLTNDGTGVLSWAAGGGGGTPGGLNTQFQYNNAGAFAGTPALTYDSINSRVSVLAPLGASNVARLADVQAASTGLRPQNTAGIPLHIAESNITGTYTNNTGVGTATFVGSPQLLIAGIVPSVGNQVLLVSQTAGLQNGSYMVTSNVASGFTLTRTTIVPVFGNFWVGTVIGATNYGVQYEDVTTGTIVVGTTPILYAQFGVANGGTLQAVCTAGNTTTTSIGVGGTVSAGTGGGNTNNYIQLTGALAGAPPTVSAVGGSDVNVGLVLAAGGTGQITVSSSSRITLGSNTNNVRIIPVSTGFSPLITANGDANVALTLSASGTGAVNISNAGANFVKITGSATIPTIGAAGSTDTSLSITPSGLGKVILGNTASFTGLTIDSNNTQNTVVLGATGVAGTNVSIVLLPQNAGDLFPIGSSLSSTLANQPGIWVAASKGATAVDPGAIGSVMTSNYINSAPYWGFPGANMTIFTTDTNSDITSVGKFTLRCFLTAINGLNLSVGTNPILNLSNGQITGFNANATYMINLTFGWFVYGAQQRNVEAYCSVTTTNDVVSSVPYGNGVTCASVRTDNVAVGDLTFVSATGYYVSGASAQTLYCWVYMANPLGGECINTSVTFTRIA